MTLQELWQSFKKHKEGTWILGYDDAQRLYGIIKKIKPKSILDLGGGIGCSASIMALALKDIEREPFDVIKPHITSIEQFEKCVKLAHELIPADLKEYITVEHHPQVVKQYDEVPYKYFTTFKDLPLKHYDLVIIDGPGPHYEVRNGKEYQIKLPNGDFVDLIPHLEQGAFVYLDQRVTTREVIGNYFSEYLGAVHGTKDYILAERTEKKYEGSIDKEGGLMREVGYKPEI